MSERFSPISQSDLETHYPFFNKVRERNSWITQLLYDLKGKNKAVFNHSLRVAFLATELSKLQQFSDADLLKMTKAGLLHDIGKMEIPNEILEKGILTSEERNQIEQHVRTGHRSIKKHDPGVAEIIAGHHEFQPASYPRKQNRHGGDTQPRLMQKLLALSDQTDSLLSPRSYKDAWIPAQAEKELFRRFGDQVLVKFAISTRLRIVS